MASSENYCKYCCRYFKFKDLYEQHNVTCEFFYRRSRARDRELDGHEKLPTPQEQFKLIQYLTLKVSKLENDVLRLKGLTVTRKRRVILEWLQNSGKPTPTLTFHEWSKTLDVSYEHLNGVFEGDITDGMKRMLVEVFSYEGTAPICCFTQKAGTIYIWSTCEDEPEPHWMVMPHADFVRFVNRLSHTFLRTFLNWQRDNAELIRSSEENKEKNIQYMRKINGLGQAYEERRQSELRKWLFVKIARDFEHDVEYDYV
jgi:hypothetical protein